jgi:hypothetical protein
LNAVSKKEARSMRFVKTEAKLQLEEIDKKRISIPTPPVPSSFKMEGN